jgi:type VI secretion system protein ImpK
MPEPGQGMPHPPGGAVSSAVAFQDTVPAPADPPSHRNILTAHASPVLAMAAALQSGRWRIPLDQFRLRAREEILKFDQEIQKVCSPRDRQIAKYAVCATVDDIAQNIPGVNTTQYAQQNMGVTFFGESIAGEPAPPPPLRSGDGLMTVLFLSSELMIAVSPPTIRF